MFFLYPLLCSFRGRRSYTGLAYTVLAHIGLAHTGLRSPFLKRFDSTAIKHAFWLGILGLFFFPCSFPTQEAWAVDNQLRQKLQAYVDGVEAQNQGEFSFSVRELTSGNTVFQYAESKLLRPASTLKLLTSVVALKKLGSEYRFPTEVLIDFLPQDRVSSLDSSLGLKEKLQIGAGSAVPSAGTSTGKSSLGNLYVRGYGDPRFGHRQVVELAQSLWNRGVREIENLVIDDSLFIEAPSASGPRPYQAALSATSLDYNCYTLTTAAGVSGEAAFVTLSPGRSFTLDSRVKTMKGDDSSIDVVQSPPNTSYLPSWQKSANPREKLLTLESLKLLVTGTIGLESEALTQWFATPDPVSQYAEALAHGLRRVGISIRGKNLKGAVPAEARKVLIFESDQLDVLLQELNQLSSNFVAGQIVFALGQGQDGYFRHEEGVEALRAEMVGLGFGADEFVIVDGSGLDSRNQVTSNQLVSLLVSAQKDFSIGPDLLASLSVFGRSGTLKRRVLLREEDRPRVRTSIFVDEERRSKGVWAKTGSVDNVSSVAGYAETATGERVAFAIMINGNIEKMRANQIEDEFVRLLIGIS